MYVDLNKLYYIDFSDTGCKLDDIDYFDTDSNDVPLTEIMRGFTFDSSISNFSYSSCTDFWLSSNFDSSFMNLKRYYIIDNIQILFESVEAYKTYKNTVYIKNN